MNKINYQKLLDEIIENNKGKLPTLLVHSCCAPCSSYVLDYLNKYFKISVLYYNPNIYPYEEYLKRKNEQKRLISEMNFINKVNFIDCDYDEEKYYEQIKGLEKEKEGGKRCEKCFYLRLKKTAEIAKENNFDYFVTTLTISPLKNSTLINEIGKKIGEEEGVKFLQSDFKKKEGYKKSIIFSKEYNLYRQNFCGCKYSKNPPLCD